MVDAGSSGSPIRSCTQDLSAYFAELHRDSLGPGLTVALTDSSGLIDRFEYGVADARTGRPVDATTRFQIGSVTKAMTAAAALRLAQRRDLDLHAPVTDVLQWFRVQGDADLITPYHLLTHTSGLVFLIDTVPASRLAIWGLRDTKLLFEPGTRFAYSNMGYMLLGYVLAEIIGGSFEGAMRQLVFEPLAMDQSVGVLPEDPEPPMSAGHFRMLDRHPRWSQFTAAELTGGHAGVGSTSSDVARFLTMLLGDGRVDGEAFLSPESVAFMTHGIHDSGWPGYRYGCGLYAGIEEAMAGHRIIHHAGENPGFESAMIADLDCGLGVVVLVNSWSVPWSAAFHALEVLHADVLGLPAPERPAVGDEGVDEYLPIREDPPASLAPYVGRFRAHAPLLREHVVFAKGGSLFVWRAGFGEVPLIPTGQHVFGLGSAEGAELLEFSCLADGRALQSTLGGGVYARMDVE